MARWMGRSEQWSPPSTPASQTTIVTAARKLAPLLGRSTTPTDYARAKGWTIDRRYISRRRGRERRRVETSARVQRVARGARAAPRLFDVLIVSEAVAHRPRHRSGTPAAILQLEEAGVEIRSYLNDGPITLATETGEMSAVLASMLASFERRRARERTYDALRRRAEAGGGHRRPSLRLPQPARRRRLRPARDRRGRGGCGAPHLCPLRRRRRSNPDREAAERGRRPAAEGRDGFVGPDRSPRDPRETRSTQAGSFGTAHRKSPGAAPRRSVCAQIPSGSPGRRPSGGSSRRTSGEPSSADSNFAATPFPGPMRDGRRLGGRPPGADPVTPYLLSGLITCAECGGSLVAFIRPSRHRLGPAPCAHDTAARITQSAGRVVCKNDVVICQEKLDAAFLDALDEAIDERLVADAVTKAVRKLAACLGSMADERAALLRERTQLATAIRHLVRRREAGPRHRHPARRAGDAGGRLEGAGAADRRHRWVACRRPDRRGSADGPRGGRRAGVPGHAQGRRAARTTRPTARAGWPAHPVRAVP